MFGRKKSNWLIVCHTWHVRSKGFYSKLLMDATEKDAKGQAALFAQSHEGNCCGASAEAFLLPDTVVIQQDHRSIP